MIGRRIQNQPRFEAPQPPPPSYPVPARQPELRPTYRPVLVPSPDELGIKLEEPRVEIIVPSPDDLGIAIEPLK